MMIIPIFISHMGCQNTCVFCNQRHINGRSQMPTSADIISQIDHYLSCANAKEIGIAFYGGSFTGLDMTLQRMYLNIANDYKENGKINHIRLSTRPDYINPRIVEMLVSFGVDLVELGVQSFSDEVLSASGRGHQSSSIYDAINCLKDYGMAFGIQLMFGLPGDNRERFFFSVEETIRLKPDAVRIYPTLVLKDTALQSAYADGLYIPPSLENAINHVAQAYSMLKKASLNVIRVGLQATDLIDFKGSVIAGPYHPAFKEMVLDALFYQKIRSFLEENKLDNHQELKVVINPKMISHVRGHKKENLQKLLETHPELILQPIGDPALAEGEIGLVTQGFGELVSKYGSIYQ